MPRKAKTPNIISSLLTHTTERKLAKRIGIKPSRLKKIERGEEKATKSEISKISHLNKLIPQEDELKATVKRKKELGLSREEVSKAKKAKTLKEIKTFNEFTKKHKFRFELTQKTLSWQDIHYLTNLGKADFDTMISRGRIKPETIRYSSDGRITALDRFNQPKVLVREQWVDGRFPTRYVWMKRDALDAYIEYRKDPSHSVGSDPWENPDYQIISRFGIPLWIAA